MIATTTDRVLTQAFGPSEGIGLRTKQVLLVIAGVAAMAIAAKIRVPMWPVPITMQTFVLLTVGAAYGMRLGGATMLAYLAVGAFGFDVFTSSSAENNGLAYMVGATGGYLVAYPIAAAVVGRLAERGWDRNVISMAGALLIGNVIVYGLGVPWLAWLFAAEKGMAWVLQWGMTYFLFGDALKLCLAALFVPGLWHLVGAARR